MEQVIRRPTIERLLERTFIARLKWGRQQRPAPGNQADIDRLPKGWEWESESTRARMARIGI